MTSTSDLIAAVARFPAARVLCIGDVMLDRYVYGTVDRISPEAPVPVISVEGEKAMLGGAGNVVRNLVTLGAEICFVSVVGDDAAGREITSLVGAELRIEPHLLVEGGRRTTIKTRFLASNQQLLRADRETVAAVGDTVAQDMVRRASAALRDHPVLILSDYGKGVLRQDVMAPLIRAARAAGVTIIVDPKGRDYARYAGAHILTPNRRELQDATGMPAGSTEEAVAAAHRLMEICDVGSVLVTRSQQGMSLVERGGGELHLKAEAREVFDVSGAGDTVTATLATALAAGVPLHEACMLANTAAGLVVAKVGTAVSDAGEIVTALQTRDLAVSEAKVLSRDRLLEQVEAWRRKRLTVGFTNGCFDLLHPGHVSLLTQARAQCDRLVVGLNTDASVKRLKGPGRPIQSETARAVVLASLASVDCVVLFDEETPLALIEAVRPEVLVKGADYTVEQVVGHDVVQRHGGRVFLAELTPNQSTTRTIERINAS